MKLSLEELGVESYATQLKEKEITEVKGGTTPSCFGPLWDQQLFLDVPASPPSSYPYHGIQTVPTPPPTVTIPNAPPKPSS